MGKTKLIPALARKAAAAALGMITMAAAFAAPDESLTGNEFWGAFLATKAVMLASGLAFWKIANHNRKDI